MESKNTIKEKSTKALKLLIVTLGLVSLILSNIAIQKWGISKDALIIIGMIYGFFAINYK